MAACAEGAISLKAGKLTLKGPETGRNADPEPVVKKRRTAGRILWGIALAVLVLAVVWFNFVEKPESAANPAAAVTEETGSLPVGG